MSTNQQNETGFSTREENKASVEQQQKFNIQNQRQFWLVLQIVACIIGFFRNWFVFVLALSFIAAAFVTVGGLLGYPFWAIIELASMATNSSVTQDVTTSELMHQVGIIGLVGVATGLQIWSLAWLWQNRYQLLRLPKGKTLPMAITACVASCLTPLTLAILFALAARWLNKKLDPVDGWTWLHEGENPWWFGGWPIPRWSVLTAWILTPLFFIFGMTAASTKFLYLPEWAQQYAKVVGGVAILPFVICGPLTLLLVVILNRIWLAIHMQLVIWEAEAPAQTTSTLAKV